MKSYKISSETYNGYPIIYSNEQWEGAYQSDLILKSGITYTISAYIKGNGRACLFSTSMREYQLTSIELTDNFERFSLVYTPDEDVSEIRIENDTDGGLYIACFQIEEGGTATSYKPYIPSVKMLADEVSAQNESLGALGKCKNLLNPTFDTSTHNGITFTRNDDGTYSLSGSRTDTSSSAYVTIIYNLPLEKGKYKLTGAVDKNNYIRCIINGPSSGTINIYDYGDGVVLDVNETGITITLLIVSTDDTSQTRIIKPMLTTNLSANYDDFVPYTGNGETLTHDVAGIKNDLNELCNIEKVFANENTTYTYTASEMHLENDHIYDVFLKGSYPTAGCGCCIVFVKNNQYVLFTIAAEYIEFSINSSNGTLTVTNKYNGAQNTQLIVKKVV